MSEIAWAGCEPTIVVANVALRVLAARGAAYDLQPLCCFIASIAVRHAGDRGQDCSAGTATAQLPLGSVKRFSSCSNASTV